MLFLSVLICTRGLVLKQRAPRRSFFALGANTLDERLYEVSKILELPVNSTAVFRYVILMVDGEAKIAEATAQAKIAEATAQAKIAEAIAEAKIEVVKAKAEVEIAKVKNLNLEKDLLSSKQSATARGILEFYLKNCQAELNLKGNFNARIVIDSLNSTG
jgi:hypothetical protein